MHYDLQPPTVSSELESALHDLRQFVSRRIGSHFQKNENGSYNGEMGAFRLPKLKKQMSQIFPETLAPNEWVIILLALVPHLQPNFFESIILELMPSGGDFPEFGGVKGSNHRSMLPTGETAQFILAGNDLSKRLEVQSLFSEKGFFYRLNVLGLEKVKEGEPLMSGRLILQPEWLEKLLLGKESPPRFGPDFPAKHISTSMEWEDVVLHPQTLSQINDIAVWLEFNERLMKDANLGRKVKPGFRSLFYGPPGTGKTLTAALLGKQFKKEVYRVDLSQVVSKYIGETEKNLENIFRKAETKNWILFFDEADALFGKRTNVQNSHDKYANQEVSYLLQRVEDFAGLLILASNFKNNLDEAFIRRFHSIIHFPIPNSNERLLLWRKSMPAALPLDANVNLEELAKKYDMTGASILGAVQCSALQVFARKGNAILQSDLLDGIRKEYGKEEKSM
jgi:hypothetical protein